MSVVASVLTGAGLRAAMLYALDADGTIQASSSTFYAGLSMQGARVLTPTIPGARRVPHIGGDRFLGYTVLPPTDGPQAELRSAKKNLTLDALLSGQAIATVGESLYHGLATDRAGLEPQFCVVAYQTGNAADDTAAVQGASAWSSLTMPRATLIARHGNLDDNAYEHVYDVTPYIVSNYPWGPAFDQVTAEKYKNAAMLDGNHNGRPQLLAAMGDGTLTVFPFPAGIVAYSASTITVFKNGAVVTTGVTKTVSGLTFTAAPLVTDKIIVHLEIL